MLARVDVYDPTTNSWRSAPAMSHPRALFAAALGPDHRIYVIAGEGASTDAIADLEAYDPRTGTWYR